jgi:hypothetical protein
VDRTPNHDPTTTTTSHVLRSKHAPLREPRGTKHGKIQAVPSSTNTKLLSNPPKYLNPKIRELIQRATIPKQPRIRIRFHQDLRPKHYDKALQDLPSQPLRDPI